jgi:hypothetical protein
MLSATKDLDVANEILRCAQDDNSGLMYIGTLFMPPDDAYDLHP